MSSQKKLIGIGIDSVSWDRLERFLTQHSFQFIKRLLRPSEQKVFLQSENPLPFFARCFAAKEAYFKARGGTGMGETGFREIEMIEEKNNRFNIAADKEAMGEFFLIPGGLGAQVMVWGYP